MLDILLAAVLQTTAPLPFQEIKPAPIVIEVPKELTVEEKIAQNYYKCTDSQWISAEDATCIDKAPVSAAVAGNAYEWGNCTWYAKNKRPDLPNNLGNANTWYYYAENQGYPVGTTPRVGAIGTSEAGYFGHVFYVEAVNNDGTIYISEMNVEGLGVVDYRTVNASLFRYIY